VRGNLRVAQALNKGEHDEVAAFRLDLLQAMMQRRALTGGQKTVERVRVGVGDLGQFDPQHLAPDTGDGVERTVAHEAQQPRPRIAARRIEPGRIAPDLQHGVVHGIGCKGRLTRDPESDAIQGGRLKFVQSAERNSVRLGAPRQQHGDLIRSGLILEGIHHAAIIAALVKDGKHRRPAYTKPVGNY